MKRQAMGNSEKSSLGNCSGLKFHSKLVFWTNSWIFLEIDWLKLKIDVNNRLMSSGPKIFDHIVTFDGVGEKKTDVCGHVTRADAAMLPIVLVQVKHLVMYKNSFRLKLFLSVTIVWIFTCCIFHYFIVKCSRYILYECKMSRLRGFCSFDISCSFQAIFRFLKASGIDP